MMKVIQCHSVVTTELGLSGDLILANWASVIRAVCWMGAEMKIGACMSCKSFICSPHRRCLSSPPVGGTSSYVPRSCSLYDERSYKSWAFPLTFNMTSSLLEVIRSPVSAGSFSGRVFVCLHLWPTGAHMQSSTLTPAIFLPI